MILESVHEAHWFSDTGVSWVLFHTGWQYSNYLNFDGKTDSISLYEHWLH